MIESLRAAVHDVRACMPFEIVAWVVLPDHLHAVWKLPEDDANFSLRWALIKQHVTRAAQQCPSWIVARATRDANAVKARFGNGDSGNTASATKRI